MRPKGPLIVIAGATVMAVAVFLPVVIGPETAFVGVHRRYFWFDDWRQYGRALFVPFAIGLTAVWALARPRSRAARAGLKVAGAGVVIVALGAIVYDLTRSSMPQLQSAYLRGVIGLVVGASIVVVGTIVAVRSSDASREAEPEEGSGVAGPLIGLAGAFLLAVAQPVALAIGTRVDGSTFANVYAGEVAWTIWSHRALHLALLLPALCVAVSSLWVLAAPASRRAATSLMVIAAAVALFAVGAAAATNSRADRSAERAFFAQAALVAGAGAVLALVGGWLAWRRWRGHGKDAQMVAAAAALG